MDLRKELPEKTMSAEKAVKVIKPGSRVFIAPAAASRST